MSNPTVLQSKLVPFTISTDGSTYKSVVCKKAWGLTIEPQVTEDESDCGPHTAVGTSKWSMDVELIMNTTPNGSTEISANTIAGYANDGTLIYMKIQYPTSGSPGTTIYRQGQGYISNYKETASQGGFITATATIRGDGTLDLSV
jgi:hypothetical protein